MSKLTEGMPIPGRAAAPCSPCRWLVSLDYDGTLRNDTPPHISADFTALMEQMRPYGVRWGINTGRALPYLFTELAEACPVLPDFICTCERYVYLANEHQQLIPAEKHNRECAEINLRVRHEFSPILHAALAQIHLSHPQLKWEPAADDPLSVEAADSATMDELMPLLLPLCTPQVTIQRAGRYMRFSDVRFNKGTALDYVRRALKVEEHALFIMGDGQNDIDAFRHFPLAYCTAPADAHPIVQDWLQTNGYAVSAERGVVAALQNWFQKQVLPHSQ